MATNATIGALNVALGINTASFQSGLAKAQKDLTGFGKAMASIGAKFQGTFAAFAVGATSAISLTAAINGTRAALDAFGDIADKAAQAGIGTDLFQGITTFAAQSGVMIFACASPNFRSRSTIPPTR